MSLFAIYPIFVKDNFLLESYDIQKIHFHNEKCSIRLKINGQNNNNIDSQLLLTIPPHNNVEYIYIKHNTKKVNPGDPITHKYVDVNVKYRKK